MIGSPEEHGEGETSGESQLGGDEEQSIPNWRAEMRQEIRVALAETLNETPLRLPPGPSEIDAADVVDVEELTNMKAIIDSNNLANKTAIRLANISKEGNKQHFIDMIEIREEVAKATFSLKGSNVTLISNCLNVVNQAKHVVLQL